LKNQEKVNNSISDNKLIKELNKTNLTLLPIDNKTIEKTSLPENKKHEKINTENKKMIMNNNTCNKTQENSKINFDIEKLFNGQKIIDLKDINLTKHYEKTSTTNLSDLKDT